MSYIGGMLTSNVTNSNLHNAQVAAYVSAINQTNEQNKGMLFDILSDDELLLRKANVTNMVMNLQPLYKIKDTKGYIDAVYDSSILNNVPPEIILSIIATESSFRKNVKSHAGAVGPMQVLPSAWNKEKLTYDPYDFYDNIQMGGYIIRKYKESCGSWDCAFKAYNVGIGNFKRNQQLGAQHRYITKIEKMLAVIN